MGIHLLHSTHGGERTTSHDAIQNVFVPIVKDVRFHVLQEQTHVLLLPSLEYFHQRVDIVMLVDDIRTLVNVIIANPIRAYLVSWANFSCGVSMIMVAQVKERLYRDHYLIYVFFPFTIEVFECFHQQFNNFFH
jgi:hypothetical protein